jgi:3-dehydroquinate dehydratase-1
MKRPRICVTIIDGDIEAIKQIEPKVDLFEVRIDLIGPGWTEIVKLIKKPWIACNRSPREGGKAGKDEVQRIEELIWAATAGACYVDIEYLTRDLADVIPIIKARSRCIISHHDMQATPSFNNLLAIVKGQLKAGADICKIVTTAQRFKDNLTVLKLINRFPESKLVAFAMGEAGVTSRILCPLVGGYFTYACMAEGKESASGQRTVAELREIYKFVKEANVSGTRIGQ